MHGQIYCGRTMEDSRKCSERLWPCLDDRYIQQHTVPPSEASRGTWNEGLSWHRNKNIEVVWLTSANVPLDEMAYAAQFRAVLKILWVSDGVFTNIMCGPTA